MSQQPPPKPQPPRLPPWERLGSMINAILLETGKALRPHDKESGRTFATAFPRIKATIPPVAEAFHQALDELESDVLRAKAVLGRDLEELRAKRIALENPVAQPIEEPIDTSSTIFQTPGSPEPNKQQLSLQTGAEQRAGSSSMVTSQASRKPSMIAAQERDKVTIPRDDGPSLPKTMPQSSHPITSNADAVGLGIDTAGPASTPAPVTAGIHDEPLDSMIDIPGANDNEMNSKLDLDDMGLSLNDSTNTQTQDPSQTQMDFDFTTFDAKPQEVNIADTKPPDYPNTGNNNNTKQESTDDLLALTSNTAVGDNVDLDLGLGMVGAEDSVFDDAFFAGGDDGNEGGGEMVHGEFDSAFFNLP